MIYFNQRIRAKIIMVAASLWLAGCATPDLSGNAGKERKMLTPWISLTGGMPALSAPGRPSFGYTQLMQPTAISVQHGETYVVDAGLRRIFRFDRTQQALEPFTNLSADAAMNIYAAPDLTVYVTDPGRSRVLQFTRDGHLLKTFSSSIHLAHPVAVTVDEHEGRVLVADGMHDHIVVFNRLGGLLNVIVPRGGEYLARGIAAMVSGPDGLYLLDRFSRQIVVLARDGAYRQAFGKGTLADPGAIAVDRGNRVFVSDRFDNTIKVYHDGQLLGTFGGSGGAPGYFNQITGLWENQGLLYVADSLNARIQIMLVKPEKKVNKAR